MTERKSFIDKADKALSLRKQCEILDINRTSLYYQPVGVSEETLYLMNLLDRQYEKTPYYGVRKMSEFLKEKGYEVGTARTRTLLRSMNLKAIFPGPNLSKRNFQHKVYPYLLKGVKIVRPNQVWSTDITYIRLAHGFVYLVAIIDWYSRYVLSWRLSNTLDANFCVEALEEALMHGKPEIFNTDQGSQFTSIAFTNRLKEENITISMNGKGRAFDNIFVERLWRTVKYENIYLKGYQTIKETYHGLKDYFYIYNNERFHQSLNYKKPCDFYPVPFLLQQNICEIGTCQYMTGVTKMAYNQNMEVFFLQN